MLALSAIMLKSYHGLFRLLVTTNLIVGCCAATAEIYQWKDKDGQTVFSERPSPDATQKIVKPKFGKESPTAIRKLKAQTAPSKVPTADSKQAAEKVKEPTPAEKTANCSKAREILNQLKTTNRLRAKDDKGVIVYLPEEDRKARLGDAQKSIKSWCDGGKAAKP